MTRIPAGYEMTHPLDTPPASQGLSDWANELVVSNTLHMGTR